MAHVFPVGGDEGGSSARSRRVEAVRRLRVEDTGPGIASTELHRIFEPFFRGSRPQGEGSGVGLSIVKRLVETLGGSIEVENLEGAGRSGLRVTMGLPLEAEPATDRFPESLEKQL